MADLSIVYGPSFHASRTTPLLYPPQQAAPPPPPPPEPAPTPVFVGPAQSEPGMLTDRRQLMVTGVIGVVGILLVYSMMQKN